MIEINKIYQGDCLEIMPDIPDGSIDMILCDPPYGTTACKWDSVIPLDKMWLQIERVIKQNGAIVITASQPFTTILISSNINEFRYCWYWEKLQGTDPFMATIRPLNNVEDVCVFYGKQPIYNPQLSYGDPYRIIRDKTKRLFEINGQTMKQTETVNRGNRLPLRVLRFAQERGKHPTQKPTVLFEYLIKTYTNKNETVLDFTMGSGTTAIAAIQTGRNYIGIEKEQKYCDIARQRITQAQPQLF